MGWDGDFPSGWCIQEQRSADLSTYHAEVGELQSVVPGRHRGVRGHGEQSRKGVTLVVSAYRSSSGLRLSAGYFLVSWSCSAHLFFHLSRLAAASDFVFLLLYCSSETSCMYLGGSCFHDIEPLLAVFIAAKVYVDNDVPYSRGRILIA